jgi:hypothetical protein
MDLTSPDSQIIPTPFFAEIDGTYHTQLQPREILVPPLQREQFAAMQPGSQVQKHNEAETRVESPDESF